MTPTPNLINKIKQILKTPNKPLSKSPFKYELTAEAAIHNSTILEKFGFDLTRLIAAHPNTEISHGSEFRKPSVLEPILEDHEYWPYIKDSLIHGVKTKFTKINETDRKSDLEEAIHRGNHKSASERPDDLKRLVDKDLRYGFQMPITKEAARLIPHACLSPYSLVDQQTIDEEGNVIPKERLAHDQSHAYSSKKSVNDRIMKDDLIPLTYGKCFSRLLHYIHALRYRFPTKPIIGGKVDFKTAYRRANLFGHLAAMCLSMVSMIILIAFRLPFGGGYGPAKWCPFSEATCDLSNEIMNDQKWNENELFSKYAENIPPPEPFNETMPLGIARKADVEVPLEAVGKSDVHIDDIIPIGIASDRWKRLVGSVLLALDCVGRPANTDDPLPRDPLPSLSKLAAEGQLSESFTVLGWNVNTRSFEVALSDEKCTAWMKELDDLIQSKKIKAKNLEKLLGKLNWAAEIIPLARYFLRRLRLLIKGKSRFSTVYLKERHVEDAKIWRAFLQQANKGISINDLIERSPDHMLVSDAFPGGLGGFHANEGWAWRYKIPSHLQGLKPNNFLEWIGELVNVKMGKHMESIKKGDCILPVGDNTSALGWLHGVNKDDREYSVYQEISREFVLDMLEMNLTVYKQHIPGIKNILADSLSRDHHLTDDQLTNLLTFFIPQQLPPNFRIVPLPQEIISDITSYLLKKPKGQPEQKAQIRNTIEHGPFGCVSSRTPTCTMSHSWIRSHSTAELSSLVPLPKQLEQESLATNIKQGWFAAQSARPCEKWVRYSKRTQGPIQQRTCKGTSTSV